MELLKQEGCYFIPKLYLFDLKFLNIGNGPLFSTINKLMEIRNNWFTQAPNFEQLQQLCFDYCSQLEHIIISESKNYGFYMEQGVTYKIARRINLSESSKPEFKSKGLSLPGILTSSFPLFLKIQNKFSYFDLKIPVSHVKMPEILRSRRETIKSAIIYNNKHLPGFMCGGFPLQIFLAPNQNQ